MRIVGRVLGSLGGHSNTSGDKRGGARREHERRIQNGDAAKETEST